MVDHLTKPHIMTLTLQTIVTTKGLACAHLPQSSIHFLHPRISILNSRSRCYRLPISQSRSFTLRRKTTPFARTQINGGSSASHAFNIDGFLSIVEFICLVSSAAVSVYILLNNGIQKLGILVWQGIALASGAAIGAIIRQRQWRRISGAEFLRGSGSHGANLSGRVEKLEEDLRSSATVIRVLARQLEKLGIRVRVTRQSLKEPIAETAALAQKNSEVTRALAAQEDVLEKELSEVHKVLLAMQEQQQKQLELILAIGKAVKLWESKRLPEANQKPPSDNPTKPSMNQKPNLDIKQIDSLGLQKQANFENA